jgi:hypothetical protein
MMPKYCIKYELQPEEVHYISGKDGSLYVENTEEMYANEAFCVDYFYNKNENEDPDVDLRVPPTQIIITIIAIYLSYQNYHLLATDANFCLL